MPNEDQSGATEGCPHCGSQEVHYSEQSVSWWCNSCEKSFTKYCLCADCLYGKKEYCSEIWSPSATKCHDFVHRESKDFQPRGTKPGLEARTYMTTTADLAARGEIEPYHETRSGERDKDCPTCGGSKTAKFYRGQYYLDQDMVFRCAGCHGVVGENEIGESLKLLSASPSPPTPTKTDTLKRGDIRPVRVVTIGNRNKMIDVAKGMLHSIRISPMKTGGFDKSAAIRRIVKKLQGGDRIALDDDMESAVWDELVGLYNQGFRVLPEGAWGKVVRKLKSILGRTS